MFLDSLRQSIRRANPTGARAAQLDGVLGAVKGWVAMVHESGAAAGQLAPAERQLLAAALGCGRDELDERLADLDAHALTEAR